MQKPLIDMTPDEAVAALELTRPEHERYDSRKKRTHVQQMEVALQVLALTRQGKSLRSIAEQLGMTHPTASRYRSLALSTIAAPLVEEARKEQLELLDAIIEGHSEAAIGGDKDAAMTVMKALERKAKLTGTDAPTQIEATVHEITAQEAEMQALLAQAERDEKMREAALTEESNEAVTEVVPDGA